MSDVNFKYTWEGWIEAFQIMRKYDPLNTWASISAEHEIIYAGPDLNPVSPEDKTQLEELGWHYDDDLLCFYRHT